MRSCGLTRREVLICSVNAWIISLKSERSLPYVSLQSTPSQSDQFFFLGLFWRPLHLFAHCTAVFWPLDAIVAAPPASNLTTCRHNGRHALRSWHHNSRQTSPNARSLTPYCLVSNVCIALVHGIYTWTATNIPTGIYTSTVIAEYDWLCRKIPPVIMNEVRLCHLWPSSFLGKTQVTVSMCEEKIERYMIRCLPLQRICSGAMISLKSSNTTSFFAARSLTIAEKRKPLVIVIDQGPDPTVSVADNASTENGSRIFCRWRECACLFSCCREPWRCNLGWT